ncbi:MAG: hypothetical protein ACRDH5_08005, partial [bacterium]
VDTNFGTFEDYFVSEFDPPAAGFEFVSLQCTEADGVDNSTPAEGVLQTGSSLATLLAEEEETIVCRYVNKPPPGQGCTPGFWRNHPQNWNDQFIGSVIVDVPGSSFDVTYGNVGPCSGPTGVPDDTTFIKHCRGFNASFNVLASQSGVDGSSTLLNATNSPGQTELRQLNFHAAAALASANANDVDYPFTVAQVISIYQEGVNRISGDANGDGVDETIASAKNKLAAANQLGCPLD